MAKMKRVKVRVSPDASAVISVRLSKEMAIALDEEAHALGVTMSEVVRKAISEHLSSTRTYNSAQLLHLSFSWGWPDGPRP